VEGTAPARGGVYAVMLALRAADTLVIEATRSGTLARPVVLQFELTSTCNLSCRMCPLTTGTSSTARSPGPMSEATWRALVAAAQWVGRVALAGYGEPFTDPQGIDRLEELDGLGVAMAVATNGTRVTPDIARRLGDLEHLIEVNVSIDSPDPATYRQLRHGSLARAFAGLGWLGAALYERRLVVSAVLFSDNAGSWPGFPGVLAAHGVRRLSISASHDYNAYSAAHRVAPASADAIRVLEEACGRADIDVEFSNVDRTRAELEGDDDVLGRFFDGATWDPAATRQCLVPWEVPFVDKDGGVFPCCFSAAANERTVGRLGVDGPLETIWSGVAFRQFRDDLVDGRTTPSVCRRCTTVPLGTHLYADWRAELVEVEVTEGDVAVLRYRNTGRVPWTRATPMRIGTARPRDGITTLATNTWLSPNRAATVVEDVVSPGEVGTFRVPVAPEGRGYVGLVAEGRCWLPETDVLLSRSVVGRRRRRWGRRRL
jgi:MoaA/NifB/PqqE/SkfB family radical SAM enzyme